MIVVAKFCFDAAENELSEVDNLMINGNSAEVEMNYVGANIGLPGGRHAAAPLQRQLPWALPVPAEPVRQSAQKNLRQSHALPGLRTRSGLGRSSRSMREKL